MAIKFLNIRSGEVRVAKTEAHISALWASSDHSPNITQGQDFGWRLAKEVVYEMKKIKQDPVLLQQIANRLGRPTEDVGEKEILLYISSKTDEKSAPLAKVEDYEDTYREDVRKYEQEQEQRAEQAAAAEDPVEEPVEAPAPAKKSNK